MSEPKYTPGPWKIEKNSSIAYGDTEFCHFAIKSSSTDSQPSYQIATTMGDTSYLSPQEESNAHLIAAAPDLYEALKGLGYELPHDGWCFCPDNNRGLEHTAACEEANAAVKKAEGRQ